MPEPSRSPARDGILERARAHMVAHGMRDLTVPEWGCTIYWTPVTLAEREIVRRRTMSDGLADAQAHLIFLKAVDRDGNKLFDMADKLLFMNQFDSEVVSRIAGAISNDRPLGVQVEDAAKNFEATGAGTTS